MEIDLSCATDYKIELWAFAVCVVSLRKLRRGSADSPTCCQLARAVSMSHPVASEAAGCLRGFRAIYWRRSKGSELNQADAETLQRASRLQHFAFSVYGYWSALCLYLGTCKIPGACLEGVGSQSPSERSHLASASSSASGASLSSRPLLPGHSRKLCAAGSPPS